MQDTLKKAIEIVEAQLNAAPDQVKSVLMPVYKKHVIAQLEAGVSGVGSVNHYAAMDKSGIEKNTQRQIVQLMTTVFATARTI